MADSCRLVPFIKTVGSTTFTVEFLVQLKNHRSNCIQESVIRESFQKLLVEDSLGLTNSVRPAITPSYAERMAELIDGCLAFNLYGEAKVSANQIITDSSKQDFDPRLIIDLIKNIKAKLQKHSNIDMQDFSILLKTLLKNFIRQTYKEKPSKPNGWSMKPRGCGCEDCKGLDLFLTSSTLNTMRFKMAQKRRQHLQFTLPCNGSYTTETDRRGTPQTLIVNKIRPSAEYEDDFRKWQASFSSMKNMLDELRGPFMKKLLGDNYERLIELLDLNTNRKLADTVKTPSSANISTKSGISANIPQGAGVKRKAEDQLSMQERPPLRTVDNKRSSSSSSTSGIQAIKESKVQIIYLSDESEFS